MFSPSTTVPSEERSSFAPSAISGGAHSTMSVISASREEPKPKDADEDGLTDEDILQEAHEHFTAAESWERPFRERARQEFEFVDGLKHWDAQMLEERKGRPCLTFDRIGPAVDQVVNDARQSPPEPRLSPVGEGSDKETAEVLQGLVRNIENDSNARVVWATGYEHAVKCGRGWIRVLTDWEDDDSMKQKILLKRVANPFSIYPDPAADEFDYSDMRRCIVTEDLDEFVYKDIYPLSKVAGLFDFQSVGDQIRKDWFPTGSVRVAEYWKIVTKRYRLAQMNDGQMKKEEEVTPEDAANVRAWRPVEKHTVKGYKINGVEILDRWIWPGKWIPIVPIIGREVIVDGKRTSRGMVRPAMDANLSYDFMRSKEAEAIGLSPLSQWLVAEGQIENSDTYFADANRKAWTVLRYKPTMHDDQVTPVPPPIRVSPSVDTSAITGAIAHAADDIRATTSMYRPDMGEQTPDQSGRAILAIQRQGDNAHFNYHDNLAISQMHVLRIILDVAPKIYDEERLETIFDPDGSVRQVWLNKSFKDTKTGLDRIYDVKGAARYDVTLGSGPSYASRRAQAQDQLMQLTTALPQVMARATDLVLKTFDIPGVDEIADRVRPPDIQAGQDGEMPVPPQVQMQVAQMKQLLQAMSGQLQAQAEELRSQRTANESKERIAAGNNATQLAIADLKVGADQSLKLMEAQYSAISQRLEQLHALQTQQDDQQHQKDLAEQKQIADAQQQGQDQAHSAGMQADQQAHEQQMAQQPPASPMPQAA